jgi:hypothetical protein
VIFVLPAAIFANSLLTMLLLLFISFCELKTSRRGLEEAVNAARSDGIPVVSFASTDQAQLANAFLARADKIGLERAAVVALIDTRKSSDATECSDFDVDSDKCVLVTLRNADQVMRYVCRRHTVRRVGSGSCERALLETCYCLQRLTRERSRSK